MSIDYREYYRMRGDEFQPGDVIEARIVMVLGHGNDYTVYVAPDASWEADQIAKGGDKVYGGDKIAKALFRNAAQGRRAR
jgi:hypothetical protein